MISLDVVTIIGVNVALVALVTGVNYWLISRVDNDVKTVTDRIDSLACRLDGHAMRIDQLYKMFCDMQKQMKDEIVSMRKDHYDLMKEEKK